MPNTALHGVIASFLDAVSEREFDEPFKALLRQHGFYDIHFVHGGAEFGKDFIAKRIGEGSRVEQWVFQSKAGDISQPEWRQMRGQIDELRTSELSHPSFDATLSRRAVLVTTGRLTGNAPIAVQEYRTNVEARQEQGFEVWDRETLIEMLAVRPEAALAGADHGPLMQLLGAIEAGEAGDKEVEAFARRWLPADGEVLSPRALLECAVVANALRDRDRLDLSVYSALAAVRAAWAGVHGMEPPPADAVTTADAAKAMFVGFASELWERCDETLLDPTDLLARHREPGAFFTYPARCLRTLEILGLLALALPPDEGADIADYVCRFAEAHAGCAHPLSDRWAASLIPVAILLARADTSRLQAFLERIVRWMADRFENDGLGVASADADPGREIDYLLGAALEHINVPERRESLIIALILDLATAARLKDTYDIARNDFLAVNALPLIVHVDDSSEQYRRDGAVTMEINPKYAPECPVTTVPKQPPIRAATALRTTCSVRVERGTISRSRASCATATSSTRSARSSHGRDGLARNGSAGFACPSTNTPTDSPPRTSSPNTP